MASRPGPNLIERTAEELAELVALNPAGQVFPYKSNPNAIALYRVFQFGKEVGWLYVKGANEFDCTETWQLYKDGVPAGNGVSRAPYIWPSYENTPNSSKDATLQVKFEKSVDAVSKPDGLSPGTHYDQLECKVVKTS